MLDPSFALQTLIGDRLAADTLIAQHVAPENIRASAIRPGNMPAIVIAPSQVRLLGRAGNGQIVAEVRAMLHVWAIEDGSTVAQAVAGAVMIAMMDAPPAPNAGFTIVEWARPDLVWMRDPDPAQAYTQGVVALRAVMQWRAD
ncbi:DUF3168 domain-containing protein [Cypionkella psychrotolerans]|uniref:DUF3168 domain-containing protein n=1 Tax=Cypionkella psychrotolerans TaxID=1678131 RepID=UPI0006B69B1E|nr:DUF3168 domain-containing protein [Cypionkella psychrotolerans]